MLKTILALASLCVLCACQAPVPSMTLAREQPGEMGAPHVVKRIGNGAIITPATDPSIGHNIQGPSLVRVPDWAPNRLGRYYLYFADHKGAYIRLAYADHLEGPWKIHEPGALNITDTPFPHTPSAGR